MEWQVKSQSSEACIWRLSVPLFILVFFSLKTLAILWLLTKNNLQQFESISLTVPQDMYADVQDSLSPVVLLFCLYYICVPWMFCLHHVCCYFVMTVCCMLQYFVYLLPHTYTFVFVVFSCCGNFSLFNFQSQFKVALADGDISRLKARVSIDICWKLVWVWILGQYRIKIVVICLGSDM